MPNIIKDGAIVADIYQVIVEAGSLPNNDIIVSLDIWLSQKEAVLATPIKKAAKTRPTSRSDY